MNDPTLKQIKYARTLGIEDPENKSKEELSKMIDGKLGNKPNSSQNGSNQVNQAVSKHDVVISRVEKPHSYEFGPANQRHKVYYSEVNELLEHIKQLEEANLINIPVEKPGL